MGHPLAAIFLGIAACSALAGQPRFAATEKQFDFGVVRAGSPAVLHTFEFTNTGQSDLVVHGVKTTCECTTAEVSSSQLAPGGKAQLQVSYDPQGTSADPAVSGTVFVASNDPENPTAEFVMKGFVLLPWRIVPLQVDFGTAGSGETSSRDISVQSQILKTDCVHRITRLKLDAPEIRAATVELPTGQMMQEKGAYVEVNRTVRVTLQAGEGEGEHKQRLLLATDDPQSPTHVIDLRWNVGGDLAFAPEKVFVSELLGRKKKINKELALSSRSEKPFEVTKIEIESKKGGEDVEVVEKPGSTANNKVYEVSVKSRPDFGSDPKQGMIVFHTNHPGQAVVKVPYVAVVR